MTPETSESDTAPPSAPAPGPWIDLPAPRDSTHLSDLRPSRSPDDVRTSAVSPDRSPASQRYVLTAFHARGGMGEVWRCQDLSLGREVALKRLAPNNAAARERFLCEAQITGQLEHPAIVPVHDLGFDDNGKPFYVMKFVRGRSLKIAIDEFHSAASDSETAEPKAPRESGPLQLARLLKIFLDLCHAVAYAHSRGVIHRDLKPDNVMLGAFGETVVLDWGLAKFTNQPGPAEIPASNSPALSGHSTHHTQDGSILGSPLYMPPEMAEGHIVDCDQRTDVYLLGATLYEILTGRPPRQGASRDELLELARTSPPVPPRKLAPQTPRALEAICLKAMSRGRGRRYGTALALADDIQRFLAGEPVEAYPEPWWMRTRRFVRRHRRGLLRAGVAGLIALSMIAGWLSYRRAANLQARERAQSEVRQIRRLIDEARFYAASTDPPNELMPFYDPTRGHDLAREAVAAASAHWGSQLEALPLPEERAPLREELASLERHLNLTAASAPSTAATQPQGGAQDLFLQGERRRLQSASIFPASGRAQAANRDHLLGAVSLYQAALERDPTHYWARFQLGRCYLALGRTAEAVETFSTCIAVRPQTPWAYTARAVALAFLRRFEEAHRDLDRALAIAPDSLPARLNRGVLFRLQNDPVRAAAEFDRLLLLPQPPPEAGFYRAQLFLRDDEPQKALNLVNQLLARSPHFVPAHLIRAQALLALERPVEALGDLDQIARSGPSPMSASNGRGHLLRNLIPQLPRKKQRQALALAQAELASASRDGDATAGTFADLGAILHLQGEFKSAVGELSRAIVLDPTDPQLLTNRGWSYEAMDRLAEAEADFTCALRLAPTSGEALAGLGYVEARLSRSSPAQRHAALAVLHGGRDYLVLHNVACIYAKLATMDPNNTRTHEEAAITLLARALEIWRTTLTGPNEIELIALESAFAPALRARPEFQALTKAIPMSDQPASR
jgi:serine/threonine protein kinase/tetratricopeptide (TPR) repeat protein